MLHCNVNVPYVEHLGQADLVILAVPAPEVLRLAPDLPEPVRAALRQIRYDGRVAVALTLEHATYPAVPRFRQKGDISMEVSKVIVFFAFFFSPNHPKLE